MSGLTLANYTEPSAPAESNDSSDTQDAAPEPKEAPTSVGSLSDDKDDAPEPKAKKESEPKEKSEPKKDAPVRKPSMNAVTVDGKTFSEGDLIATIKQKSAIEKQYAEMQQMKQDYEAFMSSFKNNPLEVLRQQHGDKIQNLREAMIKEALEDEMLTPEQKRIRELERRHEQYEAEKQAQKAQFEEQERRSRIAAKQKEIGDVLGQAIEQSVFAKDPSVHSATIQAMAGILYNARKSGVDLSPGEIAAAVESQKMAEFRVLSSSLDAEDLVNFLGDDVVKKIRKYDIKRSTPPKGETEDTSASGSVRPDKKDGPKKFINLWDARI
jgi:hypothetical protein